MISKNVFIPSLNQSLDDGWGHFVPCVATESSLDGECVSKYTTENAVSPWYQQIGRHDMKMWSVIVCLSGELICVSGTLTETCIVETPPPPKKVFYTLAFFLKKRIEVIRQKLILCHLHDGSQYVQGHGRWDEPRAAAVRTARCLVLARQSSCFDAPGAKRAECNFSVPLWSTACWVGYSTEQASVDSMKEAGLWVKTNLWNHLWVSSYFTADDISLNVCAVGFPELPHIYEREVMGWILNPTNACKCRLDCSLIQRRQRVKTCLTFFLICSWKFSNICYLDQIKNCLVFQSWPVKCCSEHCHCKALNLSLQFLYKK